MSGHYDKQQGRNRKVINIRRGNPGEDDDRSQMNSRLRRHRRKVRARLARLGLILVLICVLLVVWLFNRSYNSYSIKASVSREDTDASRFVAYGGGFVRYSNDGVACFGSSGEMLWNYPYSMNNPEIRINNGYFAIGDMTGSQVLVFNQSGFLREITTAYTITQIELSAGGLVAASLGDGTANYVNLYDAEGNQVYSVKTTLTGEGYPLAIAISDNAQKLALAYACISGDSVTANVAFYNFAETGQSENKRLVGEDFAYVGIADMSGNFITTDGQEFNVMGNEFFSAISNKGLGTYISNPTKSANGEYIFYAAVPAIDRNGIMFGVFAGAVPLKIIQHEVESTDIGEDGVAFVSDSTGALVSHPDSSSHVLSDSA